jgi:hypothetical protein
MDYLSIPPVNTYDIHTVRSASSGASTTCTDSSNTMVARRAGVRPAPARRWCVTVFAASGVCRNTTSPLCWMTLCTRPRARGIIVSSAALMAPADCPNTVTLCGSPPIIQRHHHHIALRGQPGTVVEWVRTGAKKKGPAVQPDHYWPPRLVGRRGPDVEIETVFTHRGVGQTRLVDRIGTLHGRRAIGAGLADPSPGSWFVRRAKAEGTDGWLGIGNATEDEHTRLGYATHPPELVLTTCAIKPPCRPAIRRACYQKFGECLHAKGFGQLQGPFCLGIPTLGCVLAGV